MAKVREDHILHGVGAKARLIVWPCQSKRVQPVLTSSFGQWNVPAAAVWLVLHLPKWQGFILDIVSDYEGLVK